MPEITIRPVLADDFPGWSFLWDKYNAFYGRAGSTALPAEMTRLTWQRFLDPSEPMHALVAEYNSRIVGIVHYLFHRSTILENPTCYLQDLYTEDALRGQGIGRKLIEAVYERATSAGSKRVYWQTHETNEAAIRLYESVAERSGFIVYRKNL